MKLYQLIYVSKSVASMSKVELNEILKVAIQNNKNLSITGLLERVTDNRSGSHSV